MNNGILFSHSDVINAENKFLNVNQSEFNGGEARWITPEDKHVFSAEELDKKLGR